MRNISAYSKNSVGVDVIIYLFSIWHLQMLFLLAALIFGEAYILLIIFLYIYRYNRIAREWTQKYAM